MYLIMFISPKIRKENSGGEGVWEKKREREEGEGISSKYRIVFF